MRDNINIAIAEDHEFVREGLVSLFNRHPFIKIIFDVSNGKELYEKLKTSKPDIILLDLEMPVMSGKEVFEKIRQKYPKIKIIIITGKFYDSVVFDYMAKGASSFLYKNSKFNKLVEAIVSVKDHGAYFDENLTKILAKGLAQSKETATKIEFSETEWNILKLIREGLTSKEIAERLCLSNRTIDWHRSQMIVKTGTKNTPDLVAFAISNGHLIN